MKKITFKQLLNMVANIDYIWEDSYPVIFSVDNECYASGIDSCEQQYLARIDANKPISEILWEDIDLLDEQEPDEMVYDEIKEMLIKLCNIKNNSTIKVDFENSFNGNALY